jgi:GH15 family glucan-1,4-alpha-glucosidase
VGTLQVIDALALGPEERGHDIGRDSRHVLVRRLEVTEGTVPVHLEIVPRPEYGLIVPHVTTVSAGWDFSGGADRLRLTCDPDPDLRVGTGSVHGTFTLEAGQSIVLTLGHRRAVDPVPELVPGGRLLGDTITGWQSWSALHQGYQGPYREQVLTSARLLQALTYAPTGAVIAAPTTSLPEEPGGQANWDYRYGWLRDGSLTLHALWISACPEEAHRFFDWIISSAGAGREGHLQIMFGIGGEHDLTEHTLDRLAGYADSRPVRIGNDAWDQKQLDVLGEVLECAWILREQLGDLSPGVAEFLATTADRAADTWREPDAGIWENRGGDRHHLSSKLMCWVALDRAVRLADRLGAADRVVHWAAERAKIHATILAQGFNSTVGAFTGDLDSDRLDASVLLIPLMGFLPADDQRVLATLDVLERELGTGALLQRWAGAGNEGAFVICSYWLAAARAMAGQSGRAREIFESVTGHANDLGLLSEEIDRRDGSLIGNFPQGFSHIGLIVAAWAIAQAEGPAEKHP